jgi:citrate lyase subunit beta/citryl-CoA lyase
MNANIRPRRSVLYMPGSNSRALEKARELAADCVILDLEDAVAPEAKATARDQVAAALRKGGYGRREKILRVNGLDTPWGETDLRALAAVGADAILLPKVESATTIKQAAQILGDAGAPASLALWIMAETPRGVLDLDTIVANQPRLEAIVMGTSDLAKELRLPPTGGRAGLGHALGHCVLTARAHGLDIIDGVHLALDDPDGFLDACLQGRSLGFDGKSLIHPRQIPAANECFGISAAEVTSARKIVTAWQRAREANSGITVVAGQLIEQLHVDAAERVLALFAATEELSAQNEPTGRSAQ